VRPDLTRGHPIDNGRYRLLSSLGSGGMASVFRAWDIHNERPCAVKVIHAKIAGKKSVRRRFAREAEAMIRLDHPNVIQIFDLNLEAKQPYIVMEIAEAGSLDRWMTTHGPMPLPLLREVMLQVCAGVSAAHKQGITHRDLKPQNVLIDVSGTCRVTDFGIAQIGDSSELTKTGQTMGTWLYMAPEQRLNAKEVGHPGDIYSLGVLVYALITGDLPPDLCLVERTPQILTVLPPTFRPLVTTATAFLPEDRFASVDDMIEALEALHLPEPSALTLSLPAPPEQDFTEEGLREIHDLLDRDDLPTPTGRLDSVSGDVAGHGAHLPTYLDVATLDKRDSLHQAGVELVEAPAPPEITTPRKSRVPWRGILAGGLMSIALCGMAPVGAIAFGAHSVREAALSARQSMTTLKSSLSDTLQDELIQIGAESAPLNAGRTRCHDSAVLHPCRDYLETLSNTADEVLKERPVSSLKSMRLRTQIQNGQHVLDQAAEDHRQWVQSSETLLGRLAVAFRLAPAPPKDVP
jgi:serine/threonine protein kinase